MRRVFIVRPFGTKNEVDFDAVEAKLIQPALAGAGLQGSTTAEIFEAGNIREDMFRLLVTADLVVADVSIHNANVFYELGIRHGLRPNATFMINAGIDRFPFDLQTDRYLAYDKADPAASVAALARGLAATIASGRCDSPVYQVLPELDPPNPEVLKPVPKDFREEVEAARQSRDRGMMRLLAYEARDFAWATEGLRLVGRAQFDTKAFAGGIETFEWLREALPDDVEASQRLATLHQRMGDLAGSNRAIARVLEAPRASRTQRAEVFALKGRNSKVTWVRAMQAAASDAAASEALRDPDLGEAIEGYARGFGLDLHHFYSGLNAMSLLRLQIGLAEAFPDAWAERFDDAAMAQPALEAARARFTQLCGAVALSLQSARDELQRSGKPPDEWVRISEADFAFLTAAKPKAIAQRYRDAVKDASDFALGSARDQLELFRRLGVRAEFAAEALAAIPLPKDASAEPAAPRVILFSGHMIDKPGRPEPRFPPTRAAEDRAREMIRKAVEEEARQANTAIVGLAGGACGGDILFHETCEELGISTQLLLALPPARFCATSVAHGGPDWVERYNALCDRKPPRILSQTGELPRWLWNRNYNLWQRNNLWMLFNALATNSERLTFIALWDGCKGDGPGGTEHMQSEVQRRGQKTIVLDARTLVDLGRGLAART